MKVEINAKDGVAFVQLTWNTPEEFQEFLVGITQLKERTIYPLTWIKRAE